MEYRDIDSWRKINFALRQREGTLNEIISQTLDDQRIQTMNRVKASGKHYNTGVHDIHTCQKQMEMEVKLF
jgi:hypothetical protein